MAFLGADESEQDYLEECWTVATTLVDAKLANSFRAVPTAIRDYLYLKVGAEIFAARNASGSNSQFVVPDGSTLVRGPRNPLVPVMPIIREYVVGL